MDRAVRGPSPFTTKRALVIEGGFLKKPWAVPCTEVEGVGTFIALAKTDRQLASSVGLKFEYPVTWNCGVLSRMAEVRDKKVDALIHAAKFAADPMALADGGDTDAHIASRGRMAQFGTTRVEQVISITMPPFTTDDGEQIAQHTMKVFSTPKRGNMVTMEACVSNFDWLLKACQTTWELDNAGEPRKVEPDDLPTLPEPLYYKIGKQGDISIVCWYWTRANKKRRVQRAIGECPGNEFTEAIVKKLSNEILEVVEQRWDGGAVDDAGDDDAAVGDPASEL